MTTKETGGNAFPADPFIASRPGDESTAKRIAEGMTLRDYFAAKALVGAFNSQGFTDDLTFKEKADWVYQMADAMLEARK